MILIGYATLRKVTDLVSFGKKGNVSTKITPTLSSELFVLRHAGLDPASRIFSALLNLDSGFRPLGRRILGPEAGMMILIF